MRPKKKWRSKSPIVEHGPYSIADGLLYDVNGVSMVMLYTPRGEESPWDRALLNLLNVAAKRGTAKP